jgi:hypothetical protein
MATVDEDLIRYLAVRDRQHADEIAETLAALTDREGALFREAAVMGFVRGQMYGAAFGRKRVPSDSDMVAEVVGACLSMPDLYPVITGYVPTPEPEED